MATLPLLKLAIVYSWLSSINLHYDNDLVVQDLNAYDMVVVGNGIADPSHGDYNNSVYIIGNTTASIYGYVDSTLSQSAIEGQIDDWDAIDGVDGIFFDRFGFDFGLNRAKQNDMVDYAHTAGKKVFVNAWAPDDVFKKSQGKDHHLNTDDWYLAESHYVINGVYQAVADWEAKSDKMASYNSAAKMACITTTNSTYPFDQDKWDNAHAAHAIYQFQASGSGEPNFSASDALLPYRTRPTIHGSKFTGNLVKKAGNVYERQTNIGIHLDGSAHTVSDELD